MYEQTNEFSGSVEIINDKGKGTIRVTHTSSETKDFAEHIVKTQIKQYKKKGILQENIQPQKILFSTFTNTTRFTFFFRLTTKIEDTNVFTFDDIKDNLLSHKMNVLCLRRFYGWRIFNELSYLENL